VLIRVHPWLNKNENQFSKSGSSGGEGARRFGLAVFQIRGRRGAAHEGGRNYRRRKRGKRELGFDERIALFKALTDGKKDFVAVAVVARCDGGPMPCGACRQLLSEYAPGAKIFIADSDDLKTVREFTVQELLPKPFVTVP
jgi:hypothetical protein